MPAKTDTPAMRQYRAFKDAQPDCLLLFRMGDFYELFFEDAEKASRAVGLTLTERSEGVPMAGMPHHQLETYLVKLIACGFRVAVADQIENPKEAKGVVKRAITQVVTPGTLTADTLLSDDAPNRIAAALIEHGRAWVAIAELSTGALELADVPAESLRDLLASRAVSELLHPETMTAEALPWAREAIVTSLISGTARPAWHFRIAEAREILCKQFSVTTFEGFGIQEDDQALRCAGAIVRYLHETQAISDDTGDRNPLAHLRPPRREPDDRCCTLDSISLRALEVERTIRSGTTQGSLVGLFLGPAATGGCVTPMGKRLVRDWLRLPLRDANEIHHRHDRVEALVSDTGTRDRATAALTHVQDIGRIAARVALGRALPRDLSALGRSLAALPTITAALASQAAFARTLDQLESLESKLTPLSTRIASELTDNPPARLSDGNVFCNGLDQELDRARSLRNDSSVWLASYQEKITNQLGFTDPKARCKVGYNRVFGYYIELTAVQASQSADRIAACEMTRKQTLKNAERYITPELKAFEDEVARSEEIQASREAHLFHQLTGAIAQQIEPLNDAASLVAELDVLRAFAARAARRDWHRPTMTDSSDLSITAGRHPVLEESLEGEFTPNDADTAPASLALITGPNMAGKSTYIRQVALITLLAHAGSFVPAEAATLGICDRIFTRVGADDALHEGKSTFMVEMTETANILNNATEHSLVILDEIGRGTSTLDGLSLAWAIAEHLSADPAPRCLFATHYHELTVLADERPERVVNRHVAVQEHDGNIVFLHRILPGRAEASYGVQVARLAGLPAPIVDRAGAILETLRVQQQSPHQTMEEVGEVIRSNQEAREQNSAQLGLFTEFVPHPAIEELKSIDLNAMSPIQAFDTLRKLRESI